MINRLECYFPVFAYSKIYGSFTLTDTGSDTAFTHFHTVPFRQLESVSSPVSVTVNQNHSPPHPRFVKNSFSFYSVNFLFLVSEIKYNSVCNLTNLKSQEDCPCHVSRKCLIERIKTYNVMGWPGWATIFLHALTSPLTYNVHPWSVHCKFVSMQKRRRIFKYFHFWDTIIPLRKWIPIEFCVQEPVLFPSPRLFHLLSNLQASVGSISLNPQLVYHGPQFFRVYKTKMVHIL